jgi:hypothetical protein
MLYKIMSAILITVIVTIINFEGFYSERIFSVLSSNLFFHRREADIQEVAGFTWVII